MYEISKTVEEIRHADLQAANNIQTQCSLIRNSFAQFNRSTIDSLDPQLGLNTKKSANEFDVSGFPGTLEDSTHILSKIFLDYLNKFREESKLILDSLETNFVQIDEANLKQNTDKLISSFKELDAIIHKNQLAAAKHNQALIKTNELITELPIFPTKMQISQINKLFESILKARKETNSTIKKSIEDGNKILPKCRQQIETLANMFTEFNSSVIAYYKYFADRYLSASNEFTELANTVRESANQINPESDFKQFVDHHKFIRYDIEPKEFVQFDLSSSPVFDQIEPIKIENENPLPTPIGMARVVKNYKSDAENELTIQKGSNVLLLEKPDDNWCMIMKPIFATTGYVPSQCLEPVGDMLGILKKDCDAGPQGDFVAIIKQINANYQIENKCGVEFTMPRSTIDICFM